jgi:hypothetical protein
MMHKFKKLTLIKSYIKNIGEVVNGLQLSVSIDKYISKIFKYKLWVMIDCIIYTFIHLIITTL